MDIKEGAPAHGNPAHLLPLAYKRMIASWLEEDTPSFDYGGFVVGEEAAEARLLGKSEVGVGRDQIDTSERICVECKHRKMISPLGDCETFMLRTC